MEMKVNNANLQIYGNTPQQRPQPAAPRTEDTKTAEPNHFAAAKFADLLSLQEKRFIVQNFKPETSTKESTAHLGRNIDIRA